MFCGKNAYFPTWLSYTNIHVTLDNNGIRGEGASHIFHYHTHLLIGTDWTDTLDGELLQKGSIHNAPYDPSWVQLASEWQNQCRGVLRERCTEKIQQIYRRTFMPKCNFSEVALKLYWKHTLAWVFSCKFAVHFQNTFS